MLVYNQHGMHFLGRLEFVFPLEFSWEWKFVGAIEKRRQTPWNHLPTASSSNGLGPRIPPLTKSGSPWSQTWQRSPRQKLWRENMRFRRSQDHWTSSGERLFGNGQEQDSQEVEVRRCLESWRDSSFWSRWRWWSVWWAFQGWNTIWRLWFRRRRIQETRWPT